MDVCEFMHECIHAEETGCRAYWDFRHLTGMDLDIDLYISRGIDIDIGMEIAMHHCIVLWGSVA